MSPTSSQHREVGYKKRGFEVKRTQKALYDLGFFQHIHIKKEIGKIKTLESFGMQINVCLNK